MKILHTSDWHLGRTLYGRRCTHEYRQFLDWLLEEIKRQQVDCLLVAGDVFDSTTPSATTQGLYYSFLYNVSKTCCRHVIVIGGNHDSPSLLNAPRKLLRHLNISIVGSRTENPGDEVIPLRNENDRLKAIVCAVPYLRDRDIRQSEAGESIDDKAIKLVQGVRDHYHEVVAIAKKMRLQNGTDVPIIAMGHLFAAGGKVPDNSGVRDLYVGTLAHIHSSHFPEDISYLALGHLHLAQNVNGCETMRYCGSPLPFSFEAGERAKSVTLVEFTSQIRIDTIPVPPFLHLESVSGDEQKILEKLDSLLKSSEEGHKSILIEIHFTGGDIRSLRQQIEERLHGSSLEIIRLVNWQIARQALERQAVETTLSDLKATDVFKKCLEINDIGEEDQQELEHCFLDILRQLEEEDEQEQSE